MTRNTSLSWILKELATHFEGRGWALSEKPSSSLKMTQKPNPDVEHTLSVHEPFQPDQLPSPDHIGLACAVNVYYPGLEDTINRVLFGDDADQWKISVRLALSQLVPADHVFAGNVHLVVLGDDIKHAVRQLTEDFSACLEPVQKKLCAVSVFEDAEYVPPKISPWAWWLRRAAYFHIHADIHRREAFYAGLHHKIDEVLGPAAANDVIFSKVFGNISEIEKSIILNGAQELRRFLLAVQRM